MALLSKIRLATSQVTQRRRVTSPVQVDAMDRKIKKPGLFRLGTRLLRWRKALRVAAFRAVAEGPVPIGLAPPNPAS